MEPSNTSLCIWKVPFFDTGSQWVVFKSALCRVHLAWQSEQSHNMTNVEATSRQRLWATTSDVWGFGPTAAAAMAVAAASSGWDLRIRTDLSWIPSWCHGDSQCHMSDTELKAPKKWSMLKHIRRPRRRQGGARQRRHCNQPMRANCKIQREGSRRIGFWCGEGNVLDAWKLHLGYIVCCAQCRCKMVMCIHRRALHLFWDWLRVGTLHPVWTLAYDSRT